MISFFLEEVPDDLEQKLSEAGEYHILALTPKACFELDMLQYEYSIPDDYLIPKEVSMEHVKGITSDFNNFISLSILAVNSLRAKVYWNCFFATYLIKVKPKSMSYIGAEGSYHRWLLLRLGEYERIDPK